MENSARRRAKSGERARPRRKRIEGLRRLYRFLITELTSIMMVTAGAAAFLRVERGGALAAEADEDALADGAVWAAAEEAEEEFSLSWSASSTSMSEGSEEAPSRHKR